MRLRHVRVRDYRSVNDSGTFEVEPGKTVLVGVNEAGKTAILTALEQVKAPLGRPPFRALTDYPRARYTEVQRGERQVAEITVVDVLFDLELADRDALVGAAPQFADVTQFRVERTMANTSKSSILDGPASIVYGDIRDGLTRLRAHLEKQGADNVVGDLDAITGAFQPSTPIVNEHASAVDAWLTKALPEIDEDNAKEVARHGAIRDAVETSRQRTAALALLNERVPLFVYYSTYFAVHPRIDLRSLAVREASGDLDDGYDFGNLCLLKVVGLTAKELSALASGEPQEAAYGGNTDAYKVALKEFHDRLDDRHNRLNAASVALTQHIRRVWGDDRMSLRFVPDGHYLKVVVVDDLGVEVELDQRSEGFRWLVSFFIVFQAQSAGALKDAILLLDEPGLSLHALKQQQFRYTVGELAGTNQVIYTTHSPFMIGSDELELVRIVEMTDREAGTKVHTRIAVDDPRSIYPLQAALGYELAQTMFAQDRNLVTEGITDMMYIEALSAAAQRVGSGYQKPVAIVPAGSASKVVYYATILTSQRLKVAALLDSDQAGERAATQDELVALLDKRILRTKDFTPGAISGAEIEDLLRVTLADVAKTELGWDVEGTAATQPNRPLVAILRAEIPGFSKYRLVRAFIRWLGTHEFTDLTAEEQKGVQELFAAVNKALA